MMFLRNWAPSEPATRSLSGMRLAALATAITPRSDRHLGLNVKELRRRRARNKVARATRVAASKARRKP